MLGWYQAYISPVKPGALGPSLRLEEALYGGPWFNVLKGEFAVPVTSNRFT